ncbi:MAG: tail fiber domain-containing protein [Flavobacteriales bacterium]|nr:tail fiber domain-containing protein [Flavobacteriales bacterium]
MKTTKLLGIVSCSLLSLSAYSQDWQLGGNNNLPALNNPANQTIGTNVNRPLRFETNGTQRVLIDNGGVGVNTGRVVFGNDLPNNFTPQARLHLHQTGGVVATRFTNDNTGFTANDGLAIGISPIGDAFFINNEPDQNFSWYNQGGGAPGTLLGRMRLFDGGVGQNTGRLGLGNDLPLNFVAEDRLTLFEQTTDSINAIRFQNTNTGVTGVDGFQIGVNNSSMNVYQRQYEERPVIWEQPVDRYGGNMHEVMRLQNNQAGFMSSSSTDGYLGLNEPNPMFHIDVKTRGLLQEGEMFISCRPADVSNSRMGMANASSTPFTFAPTLFGNLDAGQSGTALRTLAVISSPQDVNTAINPVQRFIVGKDWHYNQSSTDNLNEVQNRNAFSWQNASNVKMLMNANGRLKLESGLSLVTPLTNRFVITSDVIDPGAGNVNSVGGSSGLQFTNLRSTTPALSNPGSGVLSVDASGNVIYVEGGSSNVGDYCSNSPVAPIADDYLIELDDYSYNFVSQSAGRINIGQVFCGLNADSRVYVRNNNSFQTGIRSESLQSGGIGGWFEGEKYGVYVSAPTSIPSLPSPPNTAALYANGDVVITGTPFLFNGAQPVSDSTFKTNVVSLGSGVMNIIEQLNPVSFSFTSNTFDDRVHFDQNLQYGFIAQEVETILPELIKEGHLAEKRDSTGSVVASEMNFKSMNYNALIAILTKGVQEHQDVIEEQNSIIEILDATVSIQDSLINDLNERLSSLESCLSNILPELCQVNSTAIVQNDEQTQEAIVNQLEVILKDEKSIVLEQNVPNPFAEQTVINYYIPSTVQKAQIHFYNLEGQLINTVDVNEFGNGQLKVFGSDLSSGVYSYTLVADGKIIATKKMVKTN